MATTRDAEEGFRLLRESDFTLSMDELNQELVTRGFSAIAARTFRHYGKLRKYDYDFYVPINVLDVKLLSDPIWNQSLSGSRDLHAISVPVRLRLFVDDQLVHVDGNSQEIGDGELLVVLNGQAVIDALSNLGKTQPAVEVLLSTGELLYATVVRVNLDVPKQTARMRISLNAPLHLPSLSDRTAPTMARLVFRAGLPANAQLSQVAQVFFWLYQYTDSIRRIVQEVAESQGETEIYPAVEVERISVGSIEAVIIGAGVVLKVLTSVAEKWVKIRSDYFKSEIDKENLLELRWLRHQREAQKQITAPAIIQDVTSALAAPASSAPVQGALLSASVSRPLDEDMIKDIVEKQVRVALSELFSVGQGDVTFTDPS